METTPTGHYDSQAREYHLGDLVYNPFFKDFWLVDRWLPTDEHNVETDSPYCLVLWCDRDEYVMDVDEPGGFVIERRRGEEGYEELYGECVRIAKTHKQEKLAKAQQAGSQESV